MRGAAGNRRPYRDSKVGGEKAMDSGCPRFFREDHRTVDRHRLSFYLPLCPASPGNRIGLYVFDILLGCEAGNRRFGIDAGIQFSYEQPLDARGERFETGIGFDCSQPADAGGCQPPERSLRCDFRREVTRA